MEFLLGLVVGAATMYFAPRDKIDSGIQKIKDLIADLQSKFK